MKNFKLITTMVALLSFQTAFSQTRPNRPLKPERDAVQAQMEITRGAIALMLEELRNSKDNQDGYSHPDFERAAAAFEKKLTQGLLQYEADLESKIVKSMGELIKQFNTINRSTVYSNDQKADLLEAVFRTAHGSAPHYAKMHKELITNLLNVTGVPVNEVVVTGANHLGADTVFESEVHPSVRNQGIINRYATAYPGVNVVYSYSSLDFDVLKNHQYSILLSGCNTSSCMVLMNNLYQKFISFVENSIDVDLTFQFKNPTVELSYFFHYFQTGKATVKKANARYSVLKHFYSTAASTLSSNLPFSISEKEYDILQDIVVDLNADKFNLVNCRLAVGAKLQDLYFGGGVIPSQVGILDLLKRRVTNLSLTEEQVTEQLNFRAESEKVIQAQQAHIDRLKTRLSELSAIKLPIKRRNEKERMELATKIKNLSSDISKAQSVLDETMLKFDETISSFKTTNGLESRKSCLNKI